MKTLKIAVLFFVYLFVVNSNIQAQKIPAFYSFGTTSGTINEAVVKVKTALSAEGFTILGYYHPEQNNHLAVVVFTNTEISTIALASQDRGIVAAALKVGLRVENGLVEISMMNPQYLFNAYLRADVDKNEAKLEANTKKAIKALKTLGTTFYTFGGKVEKSDLRKYQYMWGMPYFTDPVSLKSFNSFSEAVAKVETNLKNSSSLKLVYKIKSSAKNQAVYGVALNDKSKGEAVFLPIIGEKNIAAMPYELIINGKEVTILHGRYRIALGWPELTMGTFSKIMSTPGDIEEALKVLVN